MAPDVPARQDTALEASNALLHDKHHFPLVDELRRAICNWIHRPHNVQDGLLLEVPHPEDALQDARDLCTSRGNLALEATGQRPLHKLPLRLHDAEVPRLVHVVPHPHLEVRREAAPGHEAVELVQGVLELFVLRVDAGEDGHDRPDYVGPHVPSYRHTTNGNEVLHFVLRRDITIAHAGQCHGGPVEGEQVRAEGVVLRIRNATVSLGRDERGEPGVLLRVVGDDAARHPALRHDPRARYPVARERGDDQELDELEEYRVVSCSGVNELLQLCEAVEARPLKKTQYSKHEQWVAHVVTHKEAADPARQNRHQVDPEPTAPGRA
mmetsp:Transcript_38240/g.119387  ORF Transcript_38240/g.119387 Transcript_38240/m.119387 type:complete len:324 (-) Transcript_38240:580-1551(-)